MKKQQLAILISVALASNLAFAGNDADVDMTKFYDESVRIEQVSPGADRDYGNYADVDLNKTSGTTVDIYQDGNSNTAKVEATGKSFYFLTDNASGNIANIDQVGNSNDSTVIFSGGADLNKATIDIQGNGNITSSTFNGSHTNLNEAKITVVNGDSNHVTTLASGSFNKADVYVNGSDANQVNISQSGYLNSADVDITGGSDGNFVDIVQWGQNTAGVDITSMSFGNDVDILQSGFGSDATVNITSASDNIVYISQTSMDSANVNLSSGTNSTVTVLQR